ncbi:MAG: glycolate oxidase subunit GlcF [Rhodobacterales bacterium]|nr:glycolate oxidase subunit GlcF [Rhodobacterales bacterium]
METRFSEAQLATPAIQEANRILRTCVHCGFCTATCPTYVLLGDELDSPRGRIYQIKHMLESDKPPKPGLVKHVDRCLTCLSCMTTCPSGVDYVRLIEHARVRIEATHRRPLGERLMRTLLATVVPRPSVFRLALVAGRLGRFAQGLMPGRLKGMVAMAPDRIAAPSPVDRPGVYPAEGERRKRVVMMSGCAQQVLRPAINEATMRLLTRLGCEVVVPSGGGCCGAVVLHMGREDEARAAARRNIAAWEKVAAQDGGLDAVVSNASGCGTSVKDYGHLLADDPAWADRAAAMAALTKDVSEVLADLEITPRPGRPYISVAYHSACSLQHGQKIPDLPKTLLARAGFDVRVPAESHICCGSAGTYNILQPALSAQLKARKVANLKATGAVVVAAGNIGCLEHIGRGLDRPVVHTVELLDWATGGPKPAGL